MLAQWSDCRESRDDAGNDPLLAGTFSAHGTDFGSGEDETVDYREDRPQMIGRFRVLEKAGAGAFGTVWKAQDTELDRTVAIKVPRQGQLDAGQSKRFLQEARTSGQLRHPNIVGVHEVGRCGETVYMVADYIDGLTLAEWLECRRPTVREVAELCGKIGEAVHYAHVAGVIHRDLKPSNIIVDNSGEPHVTDFGLARRIAEEATMTADGHILGTPAYMSPEQFQGDSRRVDHRTDVYALGVILFELLTGQRPFCGSLQMLVSQVLEKESPSPREYNANVPRDLETICMQCLEKDPRRRYRTAREFAADLGRFLEGKPVAARPVSPPERFWRWYKCNGLVAGLATALFLVLVIGLIVTANQWRRAEIAAAQEAEARRELETITGQLLELANRLRKLESDHKPAEMLGLYRAGGHARADLRLAYPHPLESLQAAGRPLAAPKAAIAPPATASAAVRGGTTLRRPHPEPEKLSHSAELRAEAKSALQRLEQLAPDVARQCREALPELVGN
jgi:tRNA A-37 threonylcarbamoyl transferase component Bud32